MSRELRELDRRVAEEIFDLRNVGLYRRFSWYETTYVNVDSWDDTEEYDDGREGFFKPKLMYDIGGSTMSVVPRYSSEIRDAWRIVDGIERNPDISCEFHIRKYPNGADCEILSNNYIVTTKHSEASSVPKAICIAALRLQEEYNKDDQ